MNAILENINSTGRAFVQFAVPMLLQSGLLILILLMVDLLLRRKVRAVFRYWIWMLVLVKLVLPASLSSPVSLGNWIGDRMEYWNTRRPAAATELAEPPASAVSFDTLHLPQRPEATAPLSVEMSPEVPAVTPSTEPAVPAEQAPIISPAVSVTPLTWQAVVFVVWLVVVVTMGLLLLQRAIFVRGLVAHAREANSLMNDTFEFCRKQMGLKGKVRLKVSTNAASPAVCGLFRPVILVPHNLAPSLGARDLRAVLLHELAHIKRGDLWVNLIQTVLQIVYFYNPLLWLANAIIRRVREQAVDEAVLVAMGEKAKWYPQTLVNVAKLAFKRPALSLRLIGVVESRRALTGRVKRILNRPLPKTAKLGALGLVVVIHVENAAVVLDSDKDGLEDRFEREIGTNPRLSDTDRDGLSDYDEYCKYRTDPTSKDSDSDGKPDGDWQERREYTYTIRAVCEIRPPSGLQVINDLYQDARPLDRKGSLEDAVVVELLLFPFATPHIYAQPYPRASLDESLQEYTQPTVSMNFSPRMKQQVANIAEGAATDVEAAEKMLHWMSSETELAKYSPHWDYFHIINNEIVWHGSLGDPERDKRFLETNFFGDSMFKNKVHGTCSSTAILRGAMFRAAGLPARLVQTLPLITRYSEDPEPLVDRLRMRAMANGYDWGPGNGGANHMYNEVFLNNRWVRVDNSIGTGPFVSDRLFVKAWSSPSLNNIKEEWNNKRCFRALDVSDAYPKYKSEATRPDIAIQDRDLTVKKLADGRFKATIFIHNNGQEPTPRLKVLFYAGDPESGARKVHPGHHRAGPIMPGATWGEATYPFILRESENEIFVVVDPDNAVQESDETNNKASTAIGYASEKAASEGLVDLVVADSDLKVSKLPDGRYFVSVTIQNKGSIVSPRFRIYHYSGDPDKAGKKLGRGYHNAGPIKPGETWKECGHFRLKPDDRQIFVVIDPDQTVKESDETNNKCSTEISSGPQKFGDFDIAVEGFKITFRDKYNAYYVVASIRNKGRDATPEFPVYFFIGDPATAEPITHAAGPIKPGGVWNERSGNFGLRDGANVISVAVDPDNAFAESDESNNRAWLSVVVENGRIVKKSVSYSSPMARQRHFVRLVVGRDRMTFEGKEVTWEDLPQLLEKVPHRNNTVLTLAIASHDITLAEKNEAVARAATLAKNFRFEYLSFVGVHPLGSKGDPTHAIFEGRLQFDKEIPIPLAAGTAEEPDLVECKWIRFEKSAGHVQATLRTKCLSRLQAKWEVRVRLLNTKDTEPSYAAAILESGAEPPGTADFSEVDLQFSLGRWINMAEPASFEVRIRQLLDFPAAQTHVAADERNEREDVRKRQINGTPRKIIDSTGRKHKSTDKFIVPLASGSQLAVDNINGAINVSGQGRQECTIEAAIEVRTKSEDETSKLMEQVKVNVTQLGKRLLVKVKQPKLKANQNVTVDFEITVPRNSNLDLHAKNGAIEVADISGQIRCKTDNGEIEVAGVSGRIECKTKNGEITTKKTAGGTWLHTNNGKVNISNA
ncbi:MAG: M56 family metallopeptidase, partial [Planctomycetota bacterium]